MKKKLIWILPLVLAVVVVVVLSLMRQDAGQPHVYSPF